VQRDRLGERLRARATGQLRFVSVCVACGDQLAEAIDIEVHPGRHQLQADAVRGDPGDPPEGVVQRGEGAAERGPGMGVVALGPEQRGELVASVAPTGVGQIGKERDRLAGIDPQRRAAHLDARRPEQRQPESHVPLSSRRTAPPTLRPWIARPRGGTQPTI
jgi:hypothetical protein